MFLLIRVLFYLAVYMIFACISQDAIKDTSFCIIYHLTGVRCFGCGLSRAFCAVMHADLFTAYSFNPLIFLVFPLIAVITVNEGYVLIRRVFSPSYQKRSVGEKALLKMFPAISAQKGADSHAA